MSTEIHHSKNFKLAEIISEELVIKNADDGLNLVGNIYYEGFDGLILYEKNITPDFFELKNGIAGEILQKFSNYRIRLAIVGDFSPHTGKSIKDFIYESNQRKHINFLGTKEEAIKVLSGE